MARKKLDYTQELSPKRKDADIIQSKTKKAKNLKIILISCLLVLVLLIIGLTVSHFVEIININDIDSEINNLIKYANKSNYLDYSVVKENTKLYNDKTKEYLETTNYSFINNDMDTVYIAYSDKQLSNIEYNRVSKETYSYYVENNNMKKTNSYNRNYSLEKYKEVGLKSLDTILAFKDKDSVKELIFNEIQSNVYKVTLYRELVDYKVSVIDDTFIVEGTYNDLINKNYNVLERNINSIKVTLKIKYNDKKIINYYLNTMFYLDNEKIDYKTINISYSFKENKTINKELDNIIPLVKKLDNNKLEHIYPTLKIKANDILLEEISMKDLNIRDYVDTFLYSIRKDNIDFTMYLDSSLKREYDVQKIEFNDYSGYTLYLGATGLENHSPLLIYDGENYSLYSIDGEKYTVPSNIVENKRYILNGRETSELFVELDPYKLNIIVAK